MIDIHCHIIPGIDDGAKHLEESIAMARAAVNEGIHTLIATPHHKNGHYHNPKATILTELDRLNRRIEEENIPLTILPGQEIRAYGEFIEGFEQGDLLTLNATSRYIFVELPTNHIPHFVEQLLFDIQMQDLVPIIVHPERNRRLLEHPDQLYGFIRNGALSQITAASLVGKFGTQIKKFTNQLLAANLTHFIASDAHNITSRNYQLARASQMITRDYGADTLAHLMENAQLLIDNEKVISYEPEIIKPKKFLGLF